MKPEGRCIAFLILVVGMSMTLLRKVVKLGSDSDTFFAFSFRILPITPSINPFLTFYKDSTLHSSPNLLKMELFLKITSRKWMSMSLLVQNRDVEKSRIGFLSPVQGSQVNLIGQNAYPVNIS